MIISFPFENECILPTGALPRGLRCYRAMKPGYDFLNMFAKKIGENFCVFNSKQS
jgi:hypothetical protein